jgi:hypothetical protein
MQKIMITREDQRQIDYDFHHLPDTCPYCNDGIVPIPLFGIHQNLTKPGLNRYEIQVVFKCPKSDCQALFITQYSEYGDGRFYIQRDLYKPIKRLEFEKVISDISPNFITIYNQTYQAEQMGLSHITGPGYRKALEFLVKDYSIRSVNSTEEKEEILNLFLSDVINKYIDDPRIRSTANRANWLGNDETHYLRKWENNDLEDLKRLINMTTKWIVLVEDSKEFERDMPDKGPKN